MEEIISKKIYLVDSENVGDLWVTHVLALAKPEDEIIVFYTQKSPHMGYDTIRKLLADGREVDFVKCVEGKNALDFQLVTELGYRIGCEKEETEYIMVTNDTGFDAVVQYWKNKKKPVRRYNARYCQNLYNQKCVEHEKQKIGIEEPQQAEVASEQLEEKGNESSVVETAKEILYEAEFMNPYEGASAREEEKKASLKEDNTIKPERKRRVINTKTGKKENPKENKRESKNKKEIVANKVLVEKVDGEDELLKELVSCLGVNNSGEIHNALTMLLGNDGKAVYQQVKGNLKDFCTEKPLKIQEKFNVYCQLVFEHSEQKEQYPQNFSNFVYKAKDKRKNLNSFRSALQKEYGKEKGMQYYSIIKPHVKILNKM